jgi:hypothetical protein
MMMNWKISKISKEQALADARRKIHNSKKDIQNIENNQERHKELLGSEHYQRMIRKIQEKKRDVEQQSTVAQNLINIRNNEIKRIGRREIE